MTQKAKTIYIAGKMRGVPGYNRPAFDRAAARIIDAGNVPISPVAEDVKAGVPLSVFDETRKDVDWSKTPPGFDFPACRARCIAAIERADEIQVLDGWTDSYGALAEVAYALWCGKPVRDQRGRTVVGMAAKIGAVKGGEK